MFFAAGVMAASAKAFPSLETGEHFVNGRTVEAAFGPQ